MKKLKWFTVSEYVDIETGELIPKSEIENGIYYIKNKTKSHEINEQQNYGIRKFINECKRTGQTKLF